MNRLAKHVPLEKVWYYKSGVVVGRGVCGDEDYVRIESYLLRDRLGVKFPPEELTYDQYQRIVGG